MSNEELKNGTTFFFNNEEHQNNIGGDDIRDCEVLFTEQNLSARPYQIWFNGSLIYSSKTFRGVKNRLDKLASKWNLTPCENPELA